MRYASEVIRLMAAAPGHPFKKQSIVNSVAAHHAKDKRILRVGVWRVLKFLEENHQITVIERGNVNYYIWLSKSITSGSGQYL